MPQDGDQTTTWSSTEMGQDALGGVGDDEFTKFLDLENSFDTFEQQMHNSNGHTALETPMGRLAFGQTTMQGMARHNPAIMQHLDISMNTSHLPTSYPDMRPSDDQQLQYPQFHMYQHMNPVQNFQIPPTPISGEMHAAKYMSQMENAGQILFERNQASFTPLVSPAQTPVDNTWGMQEYIGADDFFSPLTSPAIEPQATFVHTNTTASPIESNPEFSLVQDLVPSAKRGRRKLQHPPARDPVRSVRQSPAMKPLSKRRQFSLSSLPLDKIETMLESHSSGSMTQPSSARVATFTSSEESLSPEPLSEALMRPPPVPSNTRSPISPLVVQSEEGDMPATPAMLMRIPGKQSTTTMPAPARPNLDVMEDIVLPDAATALPPSDTIGGGQNAGSEDDQSTPRIIAKTHKISIDSTPRTSSIRAFAAPDQADKMKRPDVKPGGRGSRKRQSVPAAAISPALRPKISPSISPLVPSTPQGIAHLSADTNALYLASKSNYQNILDGTHLPGVSYPEALAENLSSKRTSHKIAEQGRRNRINLALKEIESLLPPSIMAGIKKEKCTGSSKENDDGSPDAKGGLGQGASKASTVEMAIVYIRSLQTELQVTKRRLAAAEQRLLENQSNKS